MYQINGETNLPSLIIMKILPIITTGTSMSNGYCYQLYAYPGYPRFPAFSEQVPQSILLSKKHLSNYLSQIPLPCGLQILDK
jgi:hypothetical protein